MSGGGLRSARDAVDAARPAIARLDAARGAEDNAADLIEAWESVQAALRALLGVTTLGGHGLIREARTRSVLSLEQAHLLVALSAAAERAREPGYQPNAQDLAVARSAFGEFEAAMHQPVAAHPSHSPEPSRLTSSPTAALPVESEVSMTIEPVPPPARPRRNLLACGVAAVALVLIAGAITYYVVNFRLGPGHMRRGIAAYRRGDVALAAREFSGAAGHMKGSALPHVYLARLARDAGDAATAVRELTTAIQLEPENALALREMGAHALATGDLEMARRFYVRAAERDPNDRNAQGFLACALVRLGRWEEAQRFAQRAGPGEWTPCVNVPAPGPPG